MTAPHHLSAPETRAKIYEQLLLKVGTRMASGSLVNRDDSPLSSGLSEEDQQMLVWLQEIDVDVARTCNTDIYAKDVVCSPSSLPLLAEACFRVKYLTIFFMLCL